MPDADELLRLRDRFHAFAQNVSRRIGELQTAQRQQRRDFERLERELEKLRRELDQVTRADEIAAAVTSAVREERKQRYTVPRKLAGAAAAAILLVPAVHELAVWVVG